MGIIQMNGKSLEASDLREHLGNSMFGEGFKEGLESTPVEEEKTAPSEPIEAPEVKLPSHEELKKLNMEQLQKMAKDANIKGYHRMKEDTLIDAILKTSLMMNCLKKT